MGRFAASYDLVAHEYGWTDEQIGELPLVRLRQIIAAINTRRYLEHREENSRFSWLARSLGTLIAAGYMTEGENPAIDHAAKLTMDDIEAAALGAEPTGSAPPSVNDVRGQANNADGSFERFMRFAGGPRPTFQQ